MYLELLASLVVVLTTVSVYVIARNTDKKKQGFTQVKNFLDEQMKDITNKINTKKSELEKTIISLDATLNRANGINRVIEDSLRKVDGSLNHLEHSESFISEVQHKASEVENFLNNLLEQAHSLKKEEPFIFELQEKINFLSERYKSSEQDINNIKNNIERTLADKQSDLDSELRKNIKLLETQLNSMYSVFQKESESFLTNLQQQNQKKIDQWVQGNMSHLERISNEMEHNQSSITEFREKFTQNLEVVFQNKSNDIESFMNNLRDHFSQSYREFRNEIAVLIKSYDDNMIEFKDSTEEIQSHFKRFMDQEIKVFERRFNMFQDNLDKIDEITQEQEKKVEKTIVRKTKDMQEKFDEELNIIYKRVNDTEIDIKTLLEQFSGKINKQMDTALSDVKMYKEQVESDYRIIESKFQIIADNMDNTVNFKIKEVNQLYENSQNDIEKKILQLQNEVQTIYIKIKDQIKQDMGEFQLSIQYDKDSLENERKVILQEFRQNVDSHIDKYGGKISKITDNIARLDNSQIQLQDKLEQFLNRKTEDINLFFKEKQNKLEDKLYNVESQYKALEEQLQNFLSSRTQEVAQVINQYASSFTTNIQKLEDSRQTLLDEMKEETFDFKQNLYKDIQSTQQEITSQLNELNMKTTAQINNMGNKIDYQIKDIQTVLSDKMNQSKEFVEMQKNNFLTHINQERKGLDTYIKDLENEFKDRVIPDNMKSFELQVDHMKEKLEFEMSKMQDSFSNQISGVETKLDSTILQYQNKLKDFLSTAETSLARDKNFAQSQIESFLKEEKNKLQNINIDMSELQSHFEAEVKKNKQTLQINFDEMSDQIKDYYNQLEGNIKNKENQIMNQMVSKTDNVNSKIEDMEGRISKIDSIVYEELQKANQQSKEELNQIINNLQHNIDKNLRQMDEEVVNLKNNIDRLKYKSSENQKDSLRDFKEKIKELEQELQTSFNSFEKDVQVKRSSIDSLINERTQEVKDFLDTTHGEITDLENRFGQYKNDKKLNKLLAEVSDMENTLRRLNKQKESFNETEKNYQRMKGELDSMFTEIAKFDAKKNEVENLNGKINQTIIRAKETDERIELLNQKSLDLYQTEQKIADMNNIYTQIQEKSNVLLSKEKQLINMISKIEGNNSSIVDIESHLTELKNNIEKGFKKTDLIQTKIQEMSLQLDRVKEGEEKIDDVLSRFDEVEGLSADIQSRLKQLSGAGDKLDIAEARIRNLLGILDSNETLEKTLEKTKNLSQTNLSASNQTSSKKIPQSTIDTILRYKNNGFTNDIIANIVEMTPEEVSQIIKDSRIS